MRRLIDHLRYGMPYQGDATRDTLDALERLARVDRRQLEFDKLTQTLAALRRPDEVIEDIILTVRSGDTEVAAILLELLHDEVTDILGIRV